MEAKKTRKDCDGIIYTYCDSDDTWWGNDGTYISRKDTWGHMWVRRSATKDNRGQATYDEFPTMKKALGY